jgi:hypothetical protein
MDTSIATTDLGQGKEAAATQAVAFNRVVLAFDEHVVLRDLSFNVPEGAMRILAVGLIGDLAEIRRTLNEREREEHLRITRLIARRQAPPRNTQR